MESAVHWKVIYVELCDTRLTEIGLVGTVAAISDVSLESPLGPTMFTALMANL